MVKVPTAFRLSEETKDLIKRLAEKRDVSQAAIIAWAVRDLAEKEGIR
jgi:predicted transcriptional regulator